MLSQLLQKKHTKNFQVYDLDGSGFVELADLERCAINLAQMQGLEPESSEFLKLKEQYSAIWKNFWQRADTDGDDKVALEEYLEVADRSISDFANSTSLQDAHMAKAKAIFDILDASNDGQISLREYKIFCMAVGLTQEDAQTAFDHLDINGDGHISWDEYLQASKEFHVSDDVNASGNWLYGSYE
jgi:EF-hand domain pair